VITQAVLCGAGLGVGIWALLIWVLPPQPSLARALAAARATPPPRAPLTVSSQPVGWGARVGAPAARLLATLGLPSPARRRDLQVLGGAPETFLARKAVLALTGLLVPTLIQTVLLAGGLTPGWQLPLLAGLLAAAGGFWLPDLRLRGHAARTRTTFRHALSAYLNLIRVTLAGGAGIEAALWDAAGVGDGPAFVSLRRALSTARLTRTTPWATLRQLGEDLDIPELAELASSIALAGTEGAKVRASLAAKATALRTRQLTDAEGDAHAATERMSLPVALLFTGFLVFLGYPALATVLASV
jgi:tight adherence protein C